MYLQGIRQMKAKLAFSNQIFGFEITGSLFCLSYMKEINDKFLKTNHFQPWRLKALNSNLVVKRP